MPFVVNLSSAKTKGLTDIRSRMTLWNTFGGSCFLSDQGKKNNAGAKAKRSFFSHYDGHVAKNMPTLLLNAGAIK